MILFLELFWCYAMLVQIVRNMMSIDSINCSRADMCLKSANEEGLC
jgi:hypothetical protein